MAVAIAHCEGDRFAPDLVLEHKPPFSPDAAKQPSLVQRSRTIALLGSLRTARLATGRANRFSGAA
jgi:hypothetical protein